MTSTPYPNADPELPSEHEDHTKVPRSVKPTLDELRALTIVPGDQPASLNYWERLDASKRITNDTIDALLAELNETHGLSEDPLPDPTLISAAEFWNSLSELESHELHSAFAVLSPAAVTDAQASLIHNPDPDLHMVPGQLFRWTPLRSEIATMLANGYTNREVCAALSSPALLVTPSSIRSLMSNPVFSEEVNRLTLITDTASRAARVRLAKRVVHSLGMSTEKDLLDWLKYLQSETDGQRLNMSVLLEALNETISNNSNQQPDQSYDLDMEPTDDNNQPVPSTVTSDAEPMAHIRPGRPDTGLEFEEEASPFTSVDDDPPVFPSTFSPI